MTESDLDALFAEARSNQTLPSDHLAARIMADAAAMQPRPVRAGGRPYRSRPGLFLGRLSALLGGDGALAGVSLALGIGVVAGIVQPAPVAALTTVFLADARIEAVDLLPADAPLWEDRDD